MSDATTRRKGIPKKLRFEVLKRDDFTCAYCGASAPNVRLEVDHINPVSNGGKNNFENLITACSACNSGKGSNLLTEDLAAKEEAMKAWVEINPDEELAKEIMHGLERAKSSDEWKANNGRNIPDAATWLREKAWLRDYSNTRGGYES